MPVGVSAAAPLQAGPPHPLPNLPVKTNGQSPSRDAREKLRASPAVITSYNVTGLISPSSRGLILTSASGLTLSRTTLMSHIVVCASISRFLFFAPADHFVGERTVNECRSTSVREPFHPASSSDPRLEGPLL